jgi:hypothetical protein
MRGITICQSFAPKLMEIESKLQINGQGDRRTLQQPLGIEVVAAQMIL